MASDKTHTNRNTGLFSDPGTSRPEKRKGRLECPNCGAEWGMGRGAKAPKRREG